MKIMKRAFGDFHKFYMKWPLMYDSAYYMIFQKEI